MAKFRPAPVADRAAVEQLLNVLISEHSKDPSNIENDDTPNQLAVRFWDDSVWSKDSLERVRCTLVLKSPQSVRSLLFDPSSKKLGEAYIWGDIDIEGDLDWAFKAGEALGASWPSPAEIMRLFAAPGSHVPLKPRRGAAASNDAREEGSPAKQFAGRRGHRRLSATVKTMDLLPLVRRGYRRIGQAASRQRTSAAVRFHYDHTSEYWRLWLDKNLVYSCAYYETPTTALDVAQERKLEYVCQKLQLQRGETFLDMGCGWGALCLHAVKRYGIRAHGVTLSPQQAQFARDRLETDNVASHCDIQVMNFLDLDIPGGVDKIASIGAVEHVPRGGLESYFAKTFDLLRPGGLFVLQGITHRHGAPIDEENSFIHHYVFPDSRLETITTILAAAEAVGFEVRDVECLREHYALTLRAWRRNLECNRAAIESLSDPVTFRIFQIYLAGTAHEFARGRLGLYQTILVKPNRSGPRLPLTRSYLYHKTPVSSS